MLSHGESNNASGNLKIRSSTPASLVYRESVMGWKSRPLATAVRNTQLPIALPLCILSTAVLYSGSRLHRYPNAPFHPKSSSQSRRRSVSASR